MFQGDGFQGNAFQVGSPLLYPWAPVTATAYLDSLPDRTRTVFYQGLASVPTTPVAATTTPTTAGLQDVDKAFVRPFRATGFQFSTFTQNDQRTATPITAGIQDFDRFMVRKRVSLSETTPSYPPAFFPENEGFDDFDPCLIRRLKAPFQLNVFATISGVIASVPTTAGLQDFDLSLRRRLLASADFTFTFPTAAPFETEGFDDFDQLQPRRRRSLLDIITTVYPTTAVTLTPTTAGVEPIFGPLIKRPYLDHQYVTYPSNQNQVASTPITAGLQDLDKTFLRPFRSAQFPFAGFIVFDNRAATPITAGIQDFDRFAVQRPARLQEFGGALASQIRAITAGLQDFDRFLRRQQAQDPAQPLVAVPAAAAVAGTQPWDVLTRPRAPQAQGQAFVVTPTATATPITAGLQDLDKLFNTPFRPALQQVTSYAPTIITLAVTPAPFQFAIAGLPPFRYGMSVKLQMFGFLGQNIVTRFIVHKPGLGSLLTPQLLAGTRDDAQLLGTKDQPGIGGEVEGDN